MSSIVISLWTIDLFLPLAMPYVVMNVCTSDFFVLVWWRKRLIRSRSFFSYSFEIMYSSVENLISQRWIMRSALSITISICAPGRLVSSSGLQCQEDKAVDTTSRPSFCFIALWCLRQMSSKAFPIHERTAGVVAFFVHHCSSWELSDSINL